MSEFYINIPLNEELIANIKSAGMEQHLIHACGTTIIRICLNIKEQKKLMKNFVILHSTKTMRASCQKKAITSL